MPKVGGPSPERTANILSILTWQWVQPLLDLGYRKTLQAEDLYDLPPRETTDYCEQKWVERCENYRRKHPEKSPSAWKLVFQSGGRDLVLSFLCCPVWLASVISQVFVLKALVQAASNRDEALPWWRGFLLVFGMFISSSFQIICLPMSFATGQKAGMKIRSAVTMAVFNKLMQLKTVALGGTSSGQMLNLITNDTQKLLDGATFLAFTCFCVVDTIVVAGICIKEVGVSALPGVAVTFLALPLLIRRRAVKSTDARVRTVQEILSGVRVVKYNGWTTAFLARIGQLRFDEVGWITKAAYLRSLSPCFRDGVAPLAALVTFAPYVHLHNGTIHASTAFALIGFYSILIRVYSMVPGGALAIGESRVSIQRLQRLLDLPTGKGHSSKEELALIQKIYPRASLAVSNATFLWHLKDQENTEAMACVPGRISVSKLKRSTTNRIDITQADSHDKVDHSDVGALKNIDFSVSPGELVAVIGSVGSGKTSLLCAILGEMECVEGAFYMAKSVSYASQQPWILNDTIKNNIVFASKFDEARYKKVIFACALEHDLQTFPAGDSTEIGERGVNLSGGQKARVSLARACYSPSEIVLLDDPLAAVDVPTAKHLIQHVLSDILKGRTVILVTHNKLSLEHCDRVFLMENGKLQEVGAKEGFIQNIVFSEEDEEYEEDPLEDDMDITLIFPRNNEDESRLGGGNPHREDLKGFLDSAERKRMSCDSIHSIESGRISARKSINRRKSCDSIHSIESGRISARKSINRRKSCDSIHSIESGRISVRKSINRRKSCDSIPSIESGRISVRKSITRDMTDAAKAAAALEIGTLTVQEDRVVGEVTLQTYVDYAKGIGLFLWAVVIFLMCFAQAVRVMVDYWVSIWVSKKYNLSTHLYLGLYAVWIAGMMAFSSSRALVYTFAALKAARSVHSRMAESVLRSPQVFFDQNPVGRIINRFSKDQSIIDELLPPTGQGMFENLIAVLGVMVLVGVTMPWFLLSLPPFALVLWYCQHRYMACARELKRLDGLSRSPIYAHFAQALQGVTSIRAYGRERQMHDYLQACMDANNRAYILFVHTSRWLGVRLDFAANVCVTTIALLAVLLRHSISPGVLGVVLVQSLQLTGFFQYGLRLLTETQNHFTSVERNQAYANLPSEADPKSPPGLITDEWPEKGKVEYVKYTMAYREDLPPVLNNLSFKVNPEEKVGILGRTGAGKSSLAAALFRMVENSACSGSILIDDIDLKMVGLDDLRLRLSIIPQDPILFRGTVRLNMDPFERHSDMEIYEALAKVQLSAKIQSFNQGLNIIVEENGDNFSVGQRQLLCLARSLLRRSKVIVMDEATAAVDGETDQLIQHTMQSVFKNCTVMTIAHRIDTVIDCDRVLVLAKGGHISEFDTPVNLLRRAEEENPSENSAIPAGHVFAHMVSQAGPAVAKQLRDAAEAAENRRIARQDSETQDLSAPPVPLASE